MTTSAPPIIALNSNVLSFTEYDKLSARAKRRFESRLAKLIEENSNTLQKDPKLRRTISKSTKPRRNPHYIYSGFFSGDTSVDLAESMICTSKTNDLITFEVFEKATNATLENEKQGTFGLVRKSSYTVTYQKNAKPKVTIKPSLNAIKIARYDSQSKELFEETKIGNHLRGENTHQYLKREIKGKTKAYMSMPFHSGRNLGSVRFSELSEAETVVLIYEILSELKELQSKGIIHRDIKPQNIMYDDFTGRIRFIDFGASELETEPRKKHQCLGTLAYAAPEANIFGSATYKHTMFSDLWAALLICFQMLLKENIGLDAPRSTINKFDFSNIPPEKIEKCVNNFSNYLLKQKSKFQEQQQKTLTPQQRQTCRILINEINSILAKLEKIKQENCSAASLKLLEPYLSKEKYHYNSIVFNFFVFLRRDSLLQVFLDVLNNKDFTLPEGSKETFIEIFKNALDEDPTKRQPDNANAEIPNTQDILDKLQPIYEHCLLKLKYENLQKGITEIDDIVDTHLFPAPEKERYKNTDKHPKQKKKKEFYENTRDELLTTKLVLDTALYSSKFSQEEYNRCYKNFTEQMDKLQNDELIKKHSNRFWKIMDYVARPLARIFGYTNSLSEQAIKTAGAKEVAKGTAKLRSSLKCTTFGGGLSSSHCRTEALKENNTSETNSQEVQHLSTPK